MRKEKGSITVFLSFVLVLLFSFILTTLEATRITGAKAYVAMLSQMTGDSFLATYYYPLFKEYTLFGVDAGYGTTNVSEKEIEQRLLRHMTCGLEEMKGGLLSFEDTSVSLLEYKTMLSNQGEYFLKQVEQNCSF